MSNSTSVGSGLNSDHRMEQPCVSRVQSIELAKRLFGLEVIDKQATKELDSYDDRNVLLKGKLQRDCNAEEEYFVLKVFNSFVSRFNDSQEIQSDLLPLVNTSLIQCPVPQTSIYGKKYVVCRFKSSLKSDDNGAEKARSSSTVGSVSPADESVDFFEVVSHEKSNDVDSCIVQLLKFIEGDLLCDMEWEKELLMDFGTNIARLQELLKKYSMANQFVASASLKPPNWAWQNTNIPQSIKLHVYAVKCPNRQTLVNQIAEHYQIDVLDKLDSKEFQLIHADLNCQNVITRKNAKGGMDVVGIIDFNDMEYFHRLVDLGVAIGYLFIDASNKKYDIIQASSHVMAGYQSVFTLTRKEMEIVLVSAQARIALSLVMGAYEHILIPDNDYLLQTQKGGWEALEKLQFIPKTDILDSWKSS